MAGAGSGSVARFASLHPTAIGQKVEVIVEHFRRHVMTELDGQAKAMIVTEQPRARACDTISGCEITSRPTGYKDVKALVAFSGDLELDGETYTEAELNGFSETELPRKFDGPSRMAPYPDQYQILIVAEKYQTGFDQPKLCAMYVDRKLAGLQAVQTLSRLNRTIPARNATFVLDFQNTIEDIQNAFRPYYEVDGPRGESPIPTRFMNWRTPAEAFGILDKGEIERFAEIFYKGPLDTRRPYPA